MAITESIPVLRQASVPLAGPALADRVARTLPAMWRSLERSGGIGLAAIQVGIPERFFIVSHPFRDACFNPEILESSAEESMDQEGCLSLNGGLDKYRVSRPLWVRVAYADEKGRRVERVLEGLAARVFQHESDHLDGVLITDRGTPVPAPPAPR